MDHFQEPGHYYCRLYKCVHSSALSPSPGTWSFFTVLALCWNTADLKRNDHGPGIFDGPWFDGKPFFNLFGIDLESFSLSIVLLCRCQKRLSKKSSETDSYYVHVIKTLKAILSEIVFGLILVGVP